jgi:hypothetical protein
MKSSNNQFMKIKQISTKANIIPNIMSEYSMLEALGPLGKCNSKIP